MNKRRKFAAIFAFVSVIFLALWLPKTTLINNTIAPTLFRATLTMRSYLLSQSEYSYWFLFLSIVVIIFSIQLLKMLLASFPQAPNYNIQPTNQKKGRIRYYDKLLLRYADSTFSRQQITTNLSRMVLHSLDQPKRSYLAIERLINTDSLGTPPKVTAFIARAKQVGSIEPQPWYKRIQKRWGLQQSAEYDFLADPEFLATLEFLELQLNLTADEEELV